MNHNYQETASSRVRNVPIHIERRDGSSDDETRYSRPQQDERSQRNNQTLPHQFEQSHRDSRPSRSANTSNIDISYEPPYQQARQQQNYQTQSVPNRNPNSSQSAINQETPMEGVQGDGYANHDKENSARHTRSASRTKQPGSGRPNPRTPIPMPPPPEHPRQPKDEKTSPNQTQRQTKTGDQDVNTQEGSGQHQDQQQQQEKQGHEQQQSEETEAKKVKKVTGPLDIIERTRDEVRTLFKEIVLCAETSQTSKECRRLDELLTRCVLRLDDIDCSEHPELRPERKNIIAMIDKCTDILKRKVALNFDIQQMTAKTSA